ncbi:unnamed protein product [Rhizoctonia solani]|uniref:Protein kinase domain-containing protein n=1 Tax=Rhizoctonia solani TaxID=456999 RepID=A0A8H3HSG6_9AGAM|nr:unnamed protein product [Rhizoctonia solani]
MWTIHQPKPRTASPQTFNFLDDPPGQPAQLPTPSSTPEPKPPIRRLSIPELVSNDERFGKINTLQNAVDTFERAALPSNAVLTFDQTEEGEYLLSARPWEVDECRRVNQELWEQLQSHTHVPPTPARAPTVQPAALSYLTPPSSPEPVNKRNLALIEHLEPPNAPEPPAPSDCAHLFSTVRADQLASESLEYLTDCEDEDEWAIESMCSDIEELPTECTPGLINHCDCLDDDRMNSKRPISPNFPSSDTCDISQEKSTMGPPTNYGANYLSSRVKDLTLLLDTDCLPEWPIARGGFGEIWKGALTQGRPIAIKCLTTYSAAGDQGAQKIRKRTQRELSIWSSLKHPNILPLMGVCSFRGGTGLVSEWQDNGNAIDWVRMNPSVDRFRLCKGICAGLKYLHDTKIVHGDLRGANIMISKDGTPRLIDFGLASITEGGPFSASSTLAGTLRWMAPELQVTEGQGTTKAGDMFAFGMTMLVRSSRILESAWGQYLFGYRNYTPGYRPFRQ